MNVSDTVNLTRIMREEGILRISHTEGNFAVYLIGNIMGTGQTVGEAYGNAINQRHEVREAA